MKQTLALLLLIGALASFWQWRRTHGDALSREGSSQRPLPAGETGAAAPR